MNEYDETFLPDTFLLTDDIKAFFRQLTPADAETRAYKIVAEFKNIKRPEVEVHTSFIDWIRCMETKGTGNPCLEGIRKWYREFQSDIPLSYRFISDYEIEAMFGYLGETIPDSEMHVSSEEMTYRRK